MAAQINTGIFTSVNHQLPSCEYHILNGLPIAQYLFNLYRYYFSPEFKFVGCYTKIDFSIFAFSS